MMNGASPRALSTELWTGLAFLTRLPITRGAAATGADVAQASWSFPVIGAGIGLLAGLVYWISFALDLSPFVSALLAVATTMLVTGCLHEDGLADTVDGFGGGAARERKLEIMRDSRIGTFGVCALLVSFVLRWSAISTPVRPLTVAAALIAAHVAARAILPAFMRIVPTARADGLSAQAGRPPIASAVVAAVIGASVLGLCLGPIATAAALLLLIIAGVFMAWL